MSLGAKPPHGLLDPQIRRKSYQTIRKGVGFLFLYQLAVDTGGNECHTAGNQVGAGTTCGDSSDMMDMRRFEHTFVMTSRRVRCREGLKARRGRMEPLRRR